MSYLVLARKYRPQRFSEVVSQEHVTQTLANAIAAGRVAHAILFAGPRGTGKTTVARILAKAMNCRQGPAPEPCNECAACTEITGGHSVDVFEIDGASNNSVDQIRELRENVKYMPAHSRYKIYIIDEVHMLSTPAFNALLKTLEEPPAHVLFIFATTEVHRIPITILSRCQRYDFRRIRRSAVCAFLAEVCAREKVTVDPESLGVIAHEAGGSIRDSLSLLDQVMACGETSIPHAQVLETLGVVGRGQLHALMEALLAGDLKRYLLALEAVFDRGHDLKRVHADLIDSFRNLLVLHAGGEVERLVDLPPGDIDELQKLAQRVPLSELQPILEILHREEPAVRLSTNPKLALEMVFFKARQRPAALSIDTLIRKLDDLRREVGGEEPRPQAGGGSTEGAPPGEPTPGAGEGAMAGAPRASAVMGPAPPVPSPAPAMPAESAGDSVWQRISAAAAQRLPSLAATLKKCELRRLDDTRWEIHPPDNSYAASMLRREKNMALLREVCAEVLGAEAQIAMAANGEAAPPARPQRERSQARVQQTLNHPLVAEAIDIFSGKLVDVQVMEEADK